MRQWSGVMECWSGVMECCSHSRSGRAKVGALLKPSGFRGEPAIKARALQRPPGACLCSSEQAPQPPHGGSEVDTHFEG